ncbi:hypothetical protein HAX54_040650 [Datura stramonium]|uniref:Uncharacterized protein n=1 Tax=Datura stramonium TaxID=4076 RepID=A0ABS8VT11_DATST|nr:hypothetical protein [Datura stramonium]
MADTDPKCVSKSAHLTEVYSPSSNFNLHIDNTATRATAGANSSLNESSIHNLKDVKQLIHKVLRVLIYLWGGATALGACSALGTSLAGRTSSGGGVTTSS